MQSLLDRVYAYTSIDTNAFAGQPRRETISVKGFMAAYGIIHFPADVFSDPPSTQPGTLNTEEALALLQSTTTLTTAAEEMINLFEEMCTAFKTTPVNATYTLIPRASFNFPRLVRIFFDAFSAWKTLDETRLLKIIRNVLRDVADAERIVDMQDPTSTAKVSKYNSITEQMHRSTVKLVGLKRSIALLQEFVEIRRAIMDGPPPNKRTKRAASIRALVLIPLIS